MDTHLAREQSKKQTTTGWLVAFRLRMQSAKRAPVVASIGDPRVTAFLLALVPYHGMVSVDEDGVALNVSVRSGGSMDEALIDAKSVLYAGLKKAGISGYRVEAARMSDRSSVVQSLEQDVPVRLLSVTELAKVLGVSKQRVSKMMQTGKLPAPDATVGGAPGWLPAGIEHVLATRRQRDVELIDLP
jgi:excisionase family DNA binding protein